MGLFARMFGKVKKPAETVVNLTYGYPHPFVRRPCPHPSHKGWFSHDGGTCPVKPDTWVGVPSGTYASLDGTGLMQFRAGDAEWEHRKVAHLRDDINNFCVVDLLPESEKEILRDAAEKRRARIEADRARFS